MHLDNLPKELSTFKKIIQASQRECLQIYATDEPAKITDSKFGGHPFLPIGTKYPKDYKEMPMIFLLQINFAQLPKNQIFPEKGLLQFYVADDDYFGMNFEDPIKQRGFKILYFENPETKYETNFTFLDEVEWECPPFSGSEPFEKRLQFKKDIDYVPMYSVEFDNFFNKNAQLFRQAGDEAKVLSESYWKAIDTMLNSHKLGGYARFVQDDPRHRFPNFQHYISLLQIDSQGPFMWGDGGRAHFMIDEKDLKNKDFSKVFYKWSCF